MYKNCFELIEEIIAEISAGARNEKLNYGYNNNDVICDILGNLFRVKEFVVNEERKYLVLAEMTLVYRNINDEVDSPQFFWQEAIAHEITPLYALEGRDDNKVMKLTVKYLRKLKEEWYSKLMLQNFGAFKCAIIELIHLLQEKECIVANEDNICDEV